MTQQLSDEIADGNVVIVRTEADKREFVGDVIRRHVLASWAKRIRDEADRDATDR